MRLKDYIGEATAYDKKLMLERKDPTSGLKSVSAFANTQGELLACYAGIGTDGRFGGAMHSFTTTKTTNKTTSNPTNKNADAARQIVDAKKGGGK